MPDARRVTCQKCRKPASEVGPISWSGQCETCGLASQEAAIVQMAEHQGPIFLHWRARMAASVGATLLDSTLTST